MRLKAFSLVLSLLPDVGTAEELRLLTSFPPSQTGPLLAAFGEVSTDTVVLVLNKHTNAGVEEVVRGNARGFDLFSRLPPKPSRSSATTAVLPTLPRYTCDAVGANGYTAIALSSIGWARRADSELFMPGEWDDLLLPIYRGRIGMAVPSRSGTTQ